MTLATRCPPTAVATPRCAPSLTPVGKELLTMLNHPQGKSEFAGWVANTLNGTNDSAGYVWNADNESDNLTFNWSKDGGLTVAEGGPKVVVSVNPVTQRVTVTKEEGGQSTSRDAKIKACTEEAITLAVRAAFHGSGKTTRTGWGR